LLGTEFYSNPTIPADGMVHVVLVPGFMIPCLGS